MLLVNWAYPNNTMYNDKKAAVKIVETNIVELFCCDL